MSTTDSIPSPVRRFTTVRSIVALVLREMSATYGRSPGGYLWAVLEPVAGIALLTAVLSSAFRTPPMGDSFAFFYATGHVLFFIFNNIAQAVGLAIRYSRPLLAYPKVTFMDAILARTLLSIVTELMIFWIVMIGVILLLDIYVVVDIPSILNAFAMAISLGFGVGVMNCYLMGLFPIWQQIWSILTRPLFILSGVIFLIDNLEPWLRELLLYNPVAHVISEMRSGFYGQYDGVYVDPFYVYSISLVLSFFGLLLLRKDHRKIIDEGL